MSQITKPGRSRTTVMRDVSKERQRMNEREKHRKSVIVRIALSVLLALLIIVLLVTQNSISCMNLRQCAKDTKALSGSGSGYPITVTGSKILQTEVISGNLTVLSDTSFQVFNRNAKNAAVRFHFMSSPVMKTAGRYAIIADVGNKSYRLESVTDTIFMGNTEKSLIGCAVSENAHFALITQGSSYNTAMLSCVEVFDSEGLSLHRWHNAAQYITDVALSSEATMLAVCGVSAKDGYLQSSIILQKVGEEGSVFEMSCPDTLIYAVSFMENNTLVAIGDHCMYIISADGQNSERVDYEGALKAYDVDKKTGVALFTSEISGAESGKLTVFDENGKERFSKMIEMSGTAVSLCTSGCCVLGHGELACYRLNGSRIGVWNTSATPSNVQMIMRCAYLSDGISIDFYNLPSQNDNEESESEESEKAENSKENDENDRKKA